MHARFYNPVIARFTQEDTYRGDGLNLYDYCRNNPVKYIDPTGNSCKSKGESLAENRTDVAQNPQDNGIENYSYPQNQTDRPVTDAPNLDTKNNSEASSNNIPSKGYYNETYEKKPVKPEDVIDRWNEFLGEGEHTNIHPRTGDVDLDRIVSADGTRSIRFGKHEMNSKPSKTHYHEEIWMYDVENNVMNVDNLVVRVPQ